MRQPQIDDQFYTPSDAKAADWACHYLQEARNQLKALLLNVHYARLHDNVLRGSFYDEINAFGADMDGDLGEMIERLNAAIERWERECA